MEFKRICKQKRRGFEVSFFVCTLKNNSPSAEILYNWFIFGYKFIKTKSSVCKTLASREVACAIFLRTSALHTPSRSTLKHCLQDDDCHPGAFLSCRDDAFYTTKKRSASADLLRGASRNRTGDGGFADLCLTAWLRRHTTLIYYIKCSGKKQMFFEKKWNFF